MKITLIHPSRGRAQKARQARTEWDSLSNHRSYSHVICVDVSDSQVEQYQYEFTKFILNHDSQTLVGATNTAAKHAYDTGTDVFIFMSDDFLPCANWVHEIESRMQLDKPQVLKVEDGIQPFDNVVLTIPIMNRAMYEKLGYFWYPEYKARWCDVDLYYEVKPYITYAPGLLFQHKHKEHGEDTTYQRSDAFYYHDLKVINTRSIQGGYQNSSWLKYAMKEARRQGVRV